MLDEKVQQDALFVHPSNYSLKIKQWSTIVQLLTTPNVRCTFLCFLLIQYISTFFVHFLQALYIMV